MNGKESSYYYLISIFLHISITIFPSELFAAAGGSGGGSRNPFGGIYLLYTLIITLYAIKKSFQTKDLLKKLAKIDKTWDSKLIKERVREVFFKVQEAWMERNQEIAKEYMSERIFNELKLKTDLMIKEKQKNVLEKLDFKKVMIVEAADYKDDSKDRLWVYIKFRCYDYIIDENTGKLIEGDNFFENVFRELWKFVKVNNQWVLDEIDKSIDFSDIKTFKSFSEEFEEDKQG